jgi:hypothetical protein
VSKTRIALLTVATVTSFVALGASTASAQTIAAVSDNSPMVAVPAQLPTTGLLPSIVLPSRAVVDNLLNILYGIGQPQPGRY